MGGTRTNTAYTLLRDAVTCRSLVDSPGSHTEAPRRIADGDEQIDLVCLLIISSLIAYLAEVLLLHAVFDLQQVLANVKGNLIRVITKEQTYSFRAQFEEPLQCIRDLLTELRRRSSLLRLLLLHGPSRQVVRPFL